MQQRDTPDGYAHLFGDVYWKRNTWSVVCFALFLATSLVSFELLVSIFDNQAAWLFRNDPSLYLWLGENYGDFWWFFLSLGVLGGFRLNPDFDGE